MIAESRSKMKTILQQTVKRLRRMALNPMLLPLINRMCLRQAKRWVTEKTIFAL